MRFSSFNRFQNNAHLNHNSRKEPTALNRKPSSPDHSESAIPSQSSQPPSRSNSNLRQSSSAQNSRFNNGKAEKVKSEDYWGIDNSLLEDMNQTVKSKPPANRNLSNSRNDLASTSKSSGAITKGRQRASSVSSEISHTSSFHNESLDDVIAATTGVPKTSFDVGIWDGPLPTESSRGGATSFTASRPKPNRAMLTNQSIDSNQSNNSNSHQDRTSLQSNNSSRPTSNLRSRGRTHPNQNDDNASDAGTTSSWGNISNHDKDRHGNPSSINRNQGRRLSSDRQLSGSGVASAMNHNSTANGSRSTTPSNRLSRASVNPAKDEDHIKLARPQSNLRNDPRHSSSNPATKSNHKLISAAVTEEVNKSLLAKVEELQGEIESYKYVCY